MSDPPVPPLPPGPIYLSVHGLHGVSVGMRHADYSIQPLAPNTETFTSLVVALNIGLEMLETPTGRNALSQLGCEVVSARLQKNPPIAFTGSLDKMHDYVDHFLERVRNDFPLVVVEDPSELDGALAASNKGPWNGTLANFRPKDAGSLLFNHDRIHSMVRFHDAYEQASSGSAARNRHRRTWQDFLFMFSCATFHEMSHFFVCYLTLSNVPNTPEDVSYLNYAQGNGGESGRWLEGEVYGGSIEFFGYDSQGPDQAGIPYIIDRHKFAHRIDPEATVQFITEPRRYVFPFPVSSEGLTPQDMGQLGLRNMVDILGSSSGPPLPPHTRAMLALSSMKSFPRYSIGIDELRQRPSQGTLPLKVTVVA